MSFNQNVIENTKKEYNLIQSNDNYDKQREEKFKKWMYLPQISLIQHYLVRSQDKRSIKISDIGCGTGSDMIFFKNEFEKKCPEIDIDILGCDISIEMCKSCWNYSLNVTNTDFRDKIFIEKAKKSDIVWSNFSIIHTPLNEIESSLKILFQIVKQSGILAIGFKSSPKNHEDLDIKKNKNDSVGITRVTSFLEVEWVEKFFIKNNYEIIWKNIFPHQTGDKYKYAWVYGVKK